MTLRPPSHDARLWQFVVNRVAASALLKSNQRVRMYRRWGFDVGSATIHPHCYFHTSHLQIGDESTLAPGAFIENVAPVTIGSQTEIAVFLTVLSSTHAIGPPERRAGEWSARPVSIGAGCWIGGRVTILSGVTVGDGCVVAAGAVVVDDCEPNTLYGGVPARRLRAL